jgi:hypothetical protein
MRAVKSYSADIERLRVMLQVPKINFSDIQNAFFDMKESHASIRDDFEPIAALPSGIAVQIEAALNQRNASLKQLTGAMFAELAPYHLLEGFGVLPGPMCLFSMFYFTDMRRGMAIIARGSNCDFIRLSELSADQANGVRGLN